MKFFFHLRLLSLLLFIVLISGCSRKQEEKAPNILVILIDTLRADHLGFNGYERDTSPTIDRLAAENLNFKYAYSTSAWTPPSIASLFSGVYSSVHGHMPLKSDDDLRAQGKFSKLDESFKTLAESLAEAGYDTACFSANPMVSEKYGLKQGFEHFYSPGRESAQLVNQRSLKYLNDLRNKDKPFFLYMHYMDPHFPYTPEAPYDSMFNGPLKARQYKPREEKFIARYDGEIRYVDDKIAEMFAWFKEKGLYEDLVILLISDHGEQFMERGHLGHADRLHTEEVHVPFILKARNKKGEVKTPVSLVDVYPTLMELAGVKFEHPVNGYSVLSELEEREEKGVIMEIVRHYNQKAYINAKNTKLLLEYPMEFGLVNDKLEQNQKASLYDIYKDPWEVSPVDNKALQSEIFKEFVKEYNSVLELKKVYSTSEIEMDQDTFEKLKTLGYL